MSTGHEGGSLRLVLLPRGGNVLGVIRGGRVLWTPVIDFTVVQTGKKSSKVNGLYKTDSHEILLHNKNFTTNNAIMYTAIHELILQNKRLRQRTTTLKALNNWNEKQNV